MVEIGPVTTGDQLRRAFGCFPSGITVCALVDGTPVLTGRRALASGRGSKLGTRAQNRCDTFTGNRHRP